jgi:hypothetical protein
MVLPEFRQLECIWINYPIYEVDGRPPGDCGDELGDGVKVGLVPTSLFVSPTPTFQPSELRRSWPDV